MRAACLCFLILTIDSSPRKSKVRSSATNNATHLHTGIDVDSIEATDMDGAEDVSHTLCSLSLSLYLAFSLSRFVRRAAFDKFCHTELHLIVTHHRAILLWPHYANATDRNLMKRSVSYVEKVGRCSVAMGVRMHITSIA